MIQQSQDKYDVIFPLGWNCFIASYLREYNLRKISGPFDWAGVNSLHEVTMCMKNDFTDLLAQHKLERFSNDVVRHLKDEQYGVYFYHPILTDIDDPEVIELTDTKKYVAKIQDRAARFVRYLNGNLKILLIRLYASTEEAEEFMAECERYDSDIILLVLNHNEDVLCRRENCSIKNVVMYSIYTLREPNDRVLKETSPDKITKRNIAWKMLFQDLKLIV